MAKRSKEYKRLSKHLSKLVSKANHRYDRMQKSGWNSPAMETAKKTGGRFKNGRSMTYSKMKKEQNKERFFVINYYRKSFRRLDNFFRVC